MRKVIINNYLSGIYFVHFFKNNPPPHHQPPIIENLRPSDKNQICFSEVSLSGRTNSVRFGLISKFSITDGADSGVFMIL